MIEDYQSLIKSVVCSNSRYTLSKDEQDDIVQEVNLRLLDTSRRPDYDPARGEVKMWISVMARSMTFDALRHHKRSPIISLRNRYSPGRDEEPEFADEIENHGDDAEDALTMLLREEQQSSLDKIIKSLSLDDQHFLLISVRPDYDNDAYAERLGVLPVALRVRKHRLTEKLRQLLRAIQE